MCVSFHAVRRYVVESLQPALSTVEAYYDPSMRAEAMMAVAENAETRELTPPAVRACVCVAVFAGEGVAGVRVAVCGSNGFDTEPRDSPNEPHASPPAGFPSPFNKGLPSSSPPWKRCPEFTRQSQVRGVPKGPLCLQLRRMSERVVGWRERARWESNRAVGSSKANVSNACTHRQR